MPWCPKCKNEYRDGITTCVDCNIPLVESLEDVIKEKEAIELAIVKEKSPALRLVKYLRYSGIASATVKADATKCCYQILVDATDKKEAIKHYKAFRIVEAEQTQNQQQNNQEDADATDIESEVETIVLTPDSNESEPVSEMDELEEEFQDLEDFTEQEPDFIEELSHDEEAEVTKENSSKTKDNSNRLYAKKEDVYKENRSSGIMFLSFSILGLAFVALNITGVITLINGVFSYIVITTMFIGFLFLGLYSLKRAKEVSGDLDAERELTNNIIAYFDSLGNITSIDEAAWADLNDEVLYFKRTNLLKQMVIEKFGEQNEDYLDCIIEEYYNSHV